jgi:hypothetical protein
MDAADHQPQGYPDDAPVPSLSQDSDNKGCCQLFGWLWDRSSAVLGTPTTAALMRRALLASSQSYPDLRRIAISRERLTYTYKLPDEFSMESTAYLVPAFQELLIQMLHLTGELTGGVMVRGLARSEELSNWLPDTQEVDKWLTPEE